MECAWLSEGDLSGVGTRLVSYILMEKDWDGYKETEYSPVIFFKWPASFFCFVIWWLETSLISFPFYVFFFHPFLTQYDMAVWPEDLSSHKEEIELWEQKSIWMWSKNFRSKLCSKSNVCPFVYVTKKIQNESWWKIVLWQLLFDEKTFLEKWLSKSFFD